MLMDVRMFCDRVERDMTGLIDDLQATTRRYSDNERWAWQKSLPQLSIVLRQSRLDDFHVQFGQPGGISLEYHLPVSSSWCDAVLLGRGATQPAAVLLELKDWDVRNDQPAARESLVYHHGSLVSHPSDQVRGYAEYCRYFHSTVLAEQAEVAGCVFFTSARDVSVYQQSPYQRLVYEYPVFATAAVDGQGSLPAYLNQRLVQPDFGFAQRFESGLYAQDRNLVRQIAASILDDRTSQFVLLDEQRLGYEHCLAQIDAALARAQPDEKIVIIIEGPPGSGKSVLAAKLWAKLAGDSRIAGDVVMTSTSTAQRTNWEVLFGRQAGRAAGSGVIVPANKYNPGLTPAWLKAEREHGHDLAVTTWQSNLAHYVQTGGAKQMPDHSLQVSIVDEAHALVDPTIEGLQGVSSSGWLPQAGPQAWHIMRASRITIFLMDSEQSYRDNESTRPDRIAELAEDLGVTSITSVSLKGAQFRCGGSKEYIAWLDRILMLGEDPQPGRRWRRSAANPQGRFGFEIVRDPEELDDRLYGHHQQGQTVRLVSSYSRKWVTKKRIEPHKLAPAEKDFAIPYVRDGESRLWSRIWNYAPKGRYDWFIQAPFGTPMYDNPLAEVGCPYVVRGFDYDYLGVLWLDDLVWRDDEWRVNLSSVHETAWNLTLGRARREHRTNQVGAATQELVIRLKRGYRVLLSRAIYGVYLWIEDDETREHVEFLLRALDREE